MDTTHETPKPAPALERQPSFSADDEATLRASKSSSSPDHPATTNDYNPCQNAKILSPFYLYNHDSPRPSQDLRPTVSKPSIHVSLHDLELQDMTPSVSQEKFDAQKNKRSLADRLKFWDQSTRQQRCMTKPKKQNWLQRMPKRQRLMVKLLVAFLVTGAMVGIAVGIAAAVHSQIYGSNKTIGKV